MLFNKDGQIKGPLALLTVFPCLYAFHSYCAGASLERFESPDVIACGSYYICLFQRYELMACLLNHSLVADLRRFGPLDALGGIGAQNDCKRTAGRDV
jgi:hypothetical protein